MRNVLFLLALLWFVPSPSSAAPIQVNDIAIVAPGTYRQGNGGEFLMSTAAGSPHAFDAFRTFCVQTTEFINPNSSTAFRVASISASTAGNSSKPLDSRAAWLFEQFSLGTLGNFGFTYNSNPHAEQLQRAIWRFMGESGYAGVSNQFTTYFDNPAHLPVGIGNVRVLNLVYASTGAPAQDQLVHIPSVPEPASLALLGVGLVGLATRLRRRS